jgi:PAS domain S-box-containing protein
MSCVILVVDDDPNNLAVLRDCLAGCGYTLLAAEDGESAVARADYARPDLILLDVMMPGIDGFECCRRLKANERTRDIPVIFMTALAETAYKVKGLEVGAVDYVTKPFQREELLARIAVHLQIRELANRLREANETLEKRVAERTADLARLATAVEQIDEAILITDLETNILYVNAAFERMNGYAADEIIGRNVAVIRREDQDPRVQAAIRDELNAGRIWSGQITNRRKDGSCYEASVTASPIRDASGAVVNFVSIHRDISHELKLEQELRQAQKMEAIGTLAAGIAHDFNNVLAAIVGNSEMALDKIPGDHPVRVNVERVLEAGSRATDLVKQILTFSRQAEQEKKPLRPASVIREVLKLLRSSLPSTIDIRHEFERAAEDSVVLADPTQLHQVLMNLCTNAAHAMRAHGGVLAVNLRNLHVDEALVQRYPGLVAGEHLMLTVGDTGHGMDAATLRRIFDPYFTTKKPGEGTGMGLAVTLGIVQSHGGAITVYSEPGRGTIFQVFLPRAEGAADTEAATAEKPPHGTERILFIDDEPPLVEMAKEMLVSLGYEVVAVTSSLEALERFRATPDAFDLVVTDMTMPNLTGRELARELAAIRPEMPVVMCSGFAEFVNADDAHHAGIREFLMKPFTTMTLATTIRRALEPAP